MEKTGVGAHLNEGEQLLNGWKSFYFLKCPPRGSCRVIHPMHSIVNTLSWWWEPKIWEVPAPGQVSPLAFISRLTHPLGLGTEISATSSLPWKSLITTYIHKSPPPLKKIGKLADFYIGKEKGPYLPSLNLLKLKPVNWTIEFALTRVLRRCRIWAGSGNHYCFVSFRPSELTIEQRK